MLGTICLLMAQIEHIYEGHQNSLHPGSCGFKPKCLIASKKTSTTLAMLHSGNVLQGSRCWRVFGDLARSMATVALGGISSSTSGKPICGTLCVALLRCAANGMTRRRLGGDRLYVLSH